MILLLCSEHTWQIQFSPRIYLHLSAKFSLAHLGYSGNTDTLRNSHNTQATHTYRSPQLKQQEGWLSPTERASVSAISQGTNWLPHESHAGMSLPSPVEAFGYLKRV